MNSSRHDPSNLVETWEQFKSSRGRELQNWVEAERALVQARAAGGSDTAYGHRLMVAEAALQSAIVDFAASQNGGADPTPIALGLLRLAENALEEGAGLASARLGRQRGIDGRRRHRPER
jgi:hypothetical protein